MDAITYALHHDRDKLRQDPEKVKTVTAEILGDVFDYFDRLADGDENGPNEEAGLANRVNALMLLLEGR